MDDFPSFDISDGNVQPLIDEVHKLVEDYKISDYECITGYYNVCAASLITNLSWKLLQRYNRVWRHNNETDASYNDCPAIMEEALDIIEPEKSRIELERRKEAEMIAKVRGNRR